MSDSRRNFLLKSFSATSAAWLAANWPAEVAAAEKAQAMGAFTYSPASKRAKWTPWRPRFIPPPTRPARAKPR